MTDKKIDPYFACLVCRQIFVLGAKGDKMTRKNIKDALKTLTVSYSDDKMEMVIEKLKEKQFVTEKDNLIDIIDVRSMALMGNSSIKTADFLKLEV